MAITNFIPEVWSASLLTNLRSRLVYGQAGVINRNYEGDIAMAGDTVHITSFVDPSTRAYTRNSPITYDVLTDATRALVIDQQRYFAFSVDDIDRRQALPNFVGEVTTGASYNLVNDADSFLSGIMEAGTDAGNQLGAVAVDVDDPEGAYELLVQLRVKLQRANCPADGRFVIVPPEFYAVLLHDDRFIRADAAGTTGGLRNAQVGRAAGFDVIEANTVPEDGGAFTVIAGHAAATTYAEQIVNVEALRLETTFGDGIRGLHVYGGRVVRPTCLASAEVTVAGISGS